GPHASRKHFDAVDDRLREDIAPAGNLDDARHLVIHEIAFGASLALPKKNPVLEGPFKARSQGQERLEGILVMRMPELRADRFDYEPFGFLVFGRAAQEGRILGTLDSFLNGEPAKGFDAPIEKFPVDFLNVVSPQLGTLRRS